jgi:hypothetical protein
VGNSPLKRAAWIEVTYLDLARCVRPDAGVRLKVLYGILSFIG